MSNSTQKPDHREVQEPAPSGDGPQDQSASTDGGSGPSGNGRNLSPADEIAQLKLERDDYRDQVLRSRAEFANYQKRAKEQGYAERAYAVGTLARDLLDSIDNLGRAIDALRATGAQDVTAGLDLVTKQMLDVLAKHGVEPIPAQGHPFDPNLHDAVLQQPAPDQPEGTVVAEFLKGYKIRDRVLRPSKVAVSVKPTQT
jgi:molecular chaperone GrpE